MSASSRRSQLFLLLICFVVMPSLAAQSDTYTESQKKIVAEIDSLLNVAWATARSNPEQSITTVRAIEALQEKHQLDYKKSIALYYYAVFYKNLNRYDLSEQYFNECEAFYEAEGDKKRLAAINISKANLFSDIGNYTKSMEAVTRSLALYEALQDTNGIVSANSKLGYLLLEVGRTQEALDYHKKSEALSEATQNLSELTISYTNIALVYEKIKDFEQAKEYYKKAYELGETLDDDYGKIINRYNMANILQIMDEGEASIPFVKSCIQLADSINIPSLSAASKRLLADAMINKRQFDASLALAKSLLDTAKYNLGLKDQIETQKLIVKAQQQKGDFKNAFTSLEILKTLEDSLIGTERQEKINQLQVQYETEKKEQQIAMLDLQNQAATSLIQQKNRTILLGAIGLVLVSILCAILYRLFNSYRLQKIQLSKALEEKEFLVKEIHHRVKNNLQVISSLLQLQSRYIEEPNALAALNEGESRVRSMAIIHHHLYTGDNLSQVDVPQYIENLCGNLYASYHHKQQHINIHQAIDPIALDVSVMIPLGLIINELITNAFKYAFEGKEKGNIWIRIKETQGMLQVAVKDDGIGINTTTKKGFGSRLIETFLRKLEATSEVIIDQGTTIRIDIVNYTKENLVKKTA